MHADYLGVVILLSLFLHANIAGCWCPIGVNGNAVKPDWANPRLPPQL